MRPSPGTAVLAALLIPALASTSAPADGAEAPAGVFSIRREDGRLAIVRDGCETATYVWKDGRIRRPYFANVRTPGGIPVTRRHPPVRGEDPTDHDTMHPGLWLAFGDVNGHDVWRNRARVGHVRFVSGPEAGAGRAAFSVENRYADADGGTEICRETARYTFLARPAGTLLLWVSEIRSDHGDLSFGAQEENGLGVRIASPLRVKGGRGSIRNSLDGADEKGTWGKEAAWWDYAGPVGDRHAGILLVVAADNPFPSWGHTRDYGLVVANPFPRPRKGAPRTVVRKGKTLRLRYAILIHESAANTPRNPGANVEAIRHVLSEGK